ncbi:hypothetical protein ACQUZK_10500, partial [Streptococcus pyogenes]|uniref:hypothetical protein n=1 Tax=Streptococcus pyogenes TaxID=1314 RepID=UPI003DA13AA5
DALWAAISDPLVSDALLHEGGAFEAFLAELGELLPDDERLMAQQWALCDRSLHEVEAVRPRASVTLRDLRTGEVVT